MSKFTAAGLFAVAGYLLVTSVLVFYSVTCSGVYCGLGIVLPVMPWMLLLESVLPATVWTYFLIVGLNSVIVYFLARYLFRLFTERDHRRSFREI